VKILVVCRHVPSRGSGSPVRIRGLIAGLARSHAVSVLAFTSPAEDHSVALDELRPYCDEITTVPNERFALLPGAKRALQLRSLLSPASFARLRHESAAFQTALDRLFERRTYDIVQVETCFMANYRFPREPALVLDEHNVEYEILRRTSSVASSLPRKAYSQIDYLKVKAEEEASWRAADACAVTSPRDEAAVLDRHPDLRTAVVPNGADTEFFTPRGKRPDGPTILFFGTISHYPNTDALLFFLDRVMPILKRTHPAVRLIVVGAEPPAEIRRRAASDVIIEGQVPDVRPYLERARAVIVPLRIGGGTRLKILEAMAMAKPIVSTTLGAEGIAVHDGRDILLADTAQDFADQVGRVLDNDDLAERIGYAGRRLVETSYDWNASARKLEALYRSTLLARDRGTVLAASVRSARRSPSNFDA
jgi:glycosyltransferase involved in cell wall biosynthesis